MNILKLLQQEKPSYGTLFFRKSSRIRFFETLLFVGLIFLMYANYGYTSVFKIAAVLSAIVSISISPLIYKLIYQPEYTLTETELRIKTLKKEEVIPLISMEKSYDLRYFYYIKEEKRIIAVSSTFLEQLDQQLLLIKKANKIK